MWLYNIGIRVYETAVRAASVCYPKAKAWCEGRKGLFDRMEREIDPAGRIVWIHVASLGEFEQGRPIIERIRAEYAEYKILVTFFSPSGYEVRRNYPGADYVYYLPSDRPANVSRFLDIVKPETAIFVKYEYWLNMLAELRRRRVRTYIVSAIFRRNSIFFRPFGGMWRKALATFETLFVQNDESAQLLAELGYRNVVVAGDTRFDRVAQIAAATRRIEAVERFAAGAPLFVAGSTWEPDERILLRLADENPDVKFVIAPHETHPARIERLADRCGERAARYTSVAGGSQTAEGRQILILDTVGMLSSVYAYAKWAYIGGGFGAGIHNTLEAAVFGVPLAFGPNYLKFKEARDMVALGGARSVSCGEELCRWFAPLHSDPELLQRTGAIVRNYTADHRGATDAFFRNTVFSKR